MAEGRPDPDEVQMDTSSDEGEEKKPSNPRPLPTEKADDRPSTPTKGASRGKTEGKATGSWSCSYQRRRALHQNKARRARGKETKPEAESPATDVCSPEESRRAAEIAERLGLPTINLNEPVARGSKKENKAFIKIATITYSPKKGGARGKPVLARAVGPPLGSRGSSGCRMPSRCMSASPESASVPTSAPVVHKPASDKKKRPPTKDDRDVPRAFRMSEIMTILKVTDFAQQIDGGAGNVGNLNESLQRLSLGVIASCLERAPDNAESTESESGTCSCGTERTCPSDDPKRQVPSASECIRNSEVASEEYGTGIPKTPRTVSETVPNPEVVSEEDEKQIPETSDTASETVPNRIVSENVESDNPGTPEETAERET